MYEITAIRYDNMHGDSKTWTRKLSKNAITKKNDKWFINLGYGYRSEFGNECHEGVDSAIPGSTYRIFHQVKPKEGDMIKHEFNGKIRNFKVGPISGFLNYTAPLLENGVEVAILKFEDYYKD